MAEYRKAIAELRRLGYAIVVLSPDEVGSADPRRVEDRLVELSWDVIAYLEEE